MATLAAGSPAATASPFCRPEEDPFLLLQSTQRAIESILRRHRGRGLLRSWIKVPYGEEQITRLEEGSSKAASSPRITVFFGSRGRPVQKPRFLPLRKAKAIARKLANRHVGTVSVL